MFFRRAEAGASTAVQPISFSRKLFGATRAGGSGRPTAAVPLYRVTDVLHDGRAVNVPAREIASTVAGWLAELGVRSPLVEQLERAVDAGDWPTAYAIGQHLSVKVNSAS